MTARSMFVKIAAAVVAPVLVAAPTVAVVPPGAAGTEAASTVAVWEPPVVVGGFDTSGHSTSFVVDARNRTTIVWTHGAGGIMSLQRSADGTWSQPEVISEKPAWGAPAVAADADGNVTAVWVTHRDGFTDGVMAARRIASSSGWSDPVRISRDRRVPGYPGDGKGDWGASEVCLAVSPKGAAVVAWSWGSAVRITKPYRIQSVSHGPGRGWGEVVDVTQATQNHHPQVGIAADGTMQLLYVHHPVGHPRSLLFRSRHPGHSWSRATTAAREGYGPSLAVDRAGDALVVYMPYSSGPVLAVYRPAGGRWGTAHRLSPDPGYSLAMNGRGTALVATKGKAGHVALVRRPPHGPWSAPVSVATSAGPGGNDWAVVALNNHGDTFLSWGEEILSGRYRPSGSSWSSRFTIAPDEGGVIEYLFAQVAPNGDVVVMWDNENAALQVRVMTTTP